MLQAVTVDPAGRRIAANQEVWVAGDDEWWFEVRDSDRIDLVPEQRRYELLLGATCAGFIDYLSEAGTILLIRTEVDPTF